MGTKIFMHFWFLVVLAGFALGIYTAVPKEYKARTVVVLVRHGDRSQITRELGEAFQNNNNLTHFWRSKLPTELTLRSLVMHQRLSKVFTLEELRKKLYAGWDFAHLPFGQLTELGTKQLTLVGTQIRTRYGYLFPDDATNSSEYIHCRSTNLCRTILSMRSLLAGLLFDSADDKQLSFAFLKYRLTSQPPKVRLPLIYSRLKTEETMYPHADGPCWTMSDRRVSLIHDLLGSNPTKFHPIPSVPAYYSQLNERLKRALGLKKLNWMTWLNLMEIMVCFQNHNISLPSGITDEDIKYTIDFVTWKWGVLYKDVELVRFAIGRFIHELMIDIASIASSNISHRKRHSMDMDESDPTSRRLQQHSKASAVDISLMTSESGPKASFLVPVSDIPIPLASTRFLMYAGHDATLVPLLVLLGIYNDQWPDYSANLCIEIAMTNNHSSSLNLRAGSQRHHKFGKYMVRIIYNGDEIMIPACGALWCPLSTFMEILKPYSMTSEQYRTSCHNERYKK